MWSKKDAWEWRINSIGMDPPGVGQITPGTLQTTPGVSPITHGLDCGPQWIILTVWEKTNQQLLLIKAQVWFQRFERIRLWQIMMCCQIIMCVDRIIWTCPQMGPRSLQTQYASPRRKLLLSGRAAASPGTPRPTKCQLQNRKVSRRKTNCQCPQISLPCPQELVHTLQIIYCPLLCIIRTQWRYYRQELPWIIRCYCPRWETQHCTRGCFRQSPNAQLQYQYTGKINSSVLS